MDDQAKVLRRQTVRSSQLTLAPLTESHDEAHPVEAQTVDVMRTQRRWLRWIVPRVTALGMFACAVFAGGDRRENRPTR